MQNASHQELVSKGLADNLISQLDELELYGENECGILTITKCNLNTEIETSLNEIKQLYFKNEISRVNNQIAEIEKSSIIEAEKSEKIKSLLSQLKELAVQEQEHWPLN